MSDLQDNERIAAAIEAGVFPSRLPDDEVRAMRERKRPLAASGVSRVSDNDKAVLVHFSRRITDDELRFFHEVCQRSAPLMEPAR